MFISVLLLPSSTTTYFNMRSKSYAITNILPSSPPPLQHNNKCQQLERPTPGGKRTTTHRHQSQEELHWFHQPDQSQVRVSCVQCEPCSCFRYGETWAEQFRMVNDYSDGGGEETLDLRATESITSINGTVDVLTNSGWTSPLLGW